MHKLFMKRKIVLIVARKMRFAEQPCLLSLKMVYCMIYCVRHLFCDSLVTN